MIHLGIHTDNWRPLSVGFEGACEKIAAAGIKHIEFCAIDGQNFIAALGYDPGVPLDSNPRAVRRFLEKLGLRTSQIDGSYPMMGPNGSAYGVHYVTQTIRFAAELGCPMVDTVDGAFETPGMTRKEVFRVTCDNYRQCLSWAEDYKVVINVEPHGPYTTNPDTVARILGFFDGKHFGMNLDTGNTFISGHDPLEFAKRFRDRINHVHVKDVSPELAAAARGEDTGIAASNVYIGQGVNAANIAKVIEFFKSTKWDGVFSVETTGTEDNIRDSIAWLRKQIG